MKTKTSMGVSFEEAKAIWEGPHLEIGTIAYSEDEEIRSATIGWIKDKIYVAIWTNRDEVIRLISVRRARKNEQENFTQKIQNIG